MGPGHVGQTQVTRSMGCKARKACTVGKPFDNLGPHDERERVCRIAVGGRQKQRSEEHTSELQSHLNLVCRLLLEKKKKEIILNRKKKSVSDKGQPFRRLSSE